MKIFDQSLRKIVRLAILREQYQPRTKADEEDFEAGENLEPDPALVKKIKAASKKATGSKDMIRQLKKLQTVKIPLGGNKTVDFSLKDPMSGDIGFKITNIITKIGPTKNPIIRNVSFAGKVKDAFDASDPAVELKITGKF